MLPRSTGYLSKVFILACFISIKGFSEIHRNSSPRFDFCIGLVVTLALEVVKTLWQDEKMQNYLLDKYDFYKFNDGLVIELEKVNKISIDKTMYYDDEQDAPKKTEQNFINYNGSNFPARGLENYLEEKESLETRGCASGRYDYKGIYLRTSYNNNDIVVHCNWFDEKDKYFKRYLTEEEQKEYIELMEERQAKYIERLKKYFKRYGKNITTYGYWVNR